MRKVTRKDLASTTLARLEYSYRYATSPVPDSLLLPLKALGPNPAPDVIDAIIGNTSWTELICFSCGTSCEEAVGMGRDDSDRRTVLCENCLCRALRLINISPTLSFRK
jgi:hypothetical protein